MKEKIVGTSIDLNFKTIVFISIWIKMENSNMDVEIKQETLVGNVDNVNIQMMEGISVNAMELYRNIENVDVHSGVGNLANQIGMEVLDIENVGIHRMDGEYQIDESSVDNVGIYNLESGVDDLNIRGEEVKDNVSVLSGVASKSVSSKSRLDSIDNRLDKITDLLEVLARDKKDTAVELKKYKDVVAGNFRILRNKVKHIEDGLSHNYGELNKINLEVKQNSEKLNKELEQLSSAVIENKMEMNKSVNAMRVVMNTYVEDANKAVQDKQSNITSYWDPYARMIVQLTPEEAIKELRNTTSQLGNNFSKMAETVENVQKKVDDAECYVNLFKEQPSENAAPTVSGWIQNLNCDLERLKTEVRLKGESTELGFKKLLEGVNHHKYRIEQIEQNYNTFTDLIREVRGDIAEISLQKEVQHPVPDYGKSKTPTDRSNRPNVYDNDSKEEGDLREDKSETSFPRLNISPIHSHSKSSIHQDKKVKSCDIEMGEIRTDFAITTYNPYDTGRFSYSSNLMLYDVGDKGVIKYGLVKRPVNHTLFPNFYDYAASGYILDNESNYESMTRVIYKELSVVVNNSFLIQNFLLEWSPYLHAQDQRMERFSVGRLYLSEIKMFISLTNIDANNFEFLTAEEALTEHLKPDLAQLFANQTFMNQVYTKILSIKCTPSKDNKDKAEEGKTTYSRSEPKMGNRTTLREESPYSNVNRTSFRGFDSMNRSRTVRYVDEQDTENVQDGYGNISSRGSDPLNERSRRTEFHDRRDDDIMIKLPDDSEEHAMQLIKLYGPVVKTQTLPDFKNVFLEKLTVTNILAFLRAVLLEESRLNAGTIKIADYMTPKIIDELELTAEHALEIHKVELKGSPLEGHIRARGVQRITNMDIYKLLAFAVRPENYEELKEKMKTKVFPKSDYSFKDEASITSNFREFLMATHHYIDRFLELKKLVTYHSMQFYPDLLFKKGETLGQVDFFIYGFPCYDFVKNIVSSMNDKVRKSMESFSDFTGTFMQLLHKMDIHYTVNMKFFKTFWRQRGHYKSDDGKPDHDHRRHTTGKHRVMIMDEHQSEDEDEYAMEGNSEDTEDDGTKSDADEKDIDTEVSELSSQHDINIIQSKKTLSNNVCYEFLNKGKCTIAGCIYNHDPVAVEKFRATYKSKSFSKPKIATTPGKRRA